MGTVLVALLKVQQEPSPLHPRVIYPGVEENIVNITTGALLSETEA
ncbi:MAG: hypothetical protein PHT79_12120 [Syntrophomonadaceae bacterium]|nr:hypothetical protein [Syntrophomonadaceae bacterium]